jgi:hypothetical protein
MQSVLSVMLSEESDPTTAIWLATKMKTECRIADWSSKLSPARLAIILKLDTSGLRRKAIIAEFNAVGCEVIAERT